MVAKGGHSSVDPPRLFQCESATKDIFQKVFERATWFTRSYHVHGVENRPLLENRNRTVSYNEPSVYRPVGMGRGNARNVGTKGVHIRHPLLSRQPSFTFSAAQRSVSISDVCRTVTPLPPLPETKEGMSWISATFLLISSALGIGILNFPNAYNQAGGIFSATLIQLVMVCLIITTMMILAHCSDINSDVTYHDVLMSMCGRKAQKLAAVSIICTCYGCCVAVLIIIGDQFDRLYYTFFGSTFCHSWYLERIFTIPVISICLVLPMCYSKRVEFLRHAGSIGIFAMLYPVFLTVYGYVKHDVEPGTIKTQPDNLSQFFAVVPVLCFAYQCQEVTVPIYSCMKERTLGNFAKACFISMGFLLIVYSIIGCCGYLTFGSFVSPNVMKMYNASDPIVMIGVGALIVKMIVTYPVMALCGRGAVDGLYSELRGLSPAEFLSGEKKRRIVIVTLWFSSTLVFALYTKSIGSVIQLLGSVSCANIFIYPGVCLMMLVLMKDPDLKKYKSLLQVTGAIALAAFGAFCFGVVLINAIITLLRAEVQEEILCS